MRISRRQLLAGVPGALLAGCGAAPRSAAPAQPPSTPPSPSPSLSSPATLRDPAQYLEHARAAARFLRSQAVATPQGTAWRKSPDEPGRFELGLYHGALGTAVFFLELYRATGERDALADALAGAAHAAATFAWNPGPYELGLYGGVAGHLALCDALAADTDDPRLATWRDEMLGRLERGTVSGPDGARNYEPTDMLYGNAGVILALLPRSDDRSLALARGLGEGLLGRAEATPHGRRWRMTDSTTVDLPNFSHGTAGVAFALARLYEVTRDARYLDAAIAGAHHVISLARTAGDVCLVPHVIPGGDQRYYLSYCHGPAGTSRLFHQLHRVTGDATWSRWFQRSVNGVLYSGVPEVRTPGFWDNVGQCCGSAGIAEFLLSADRITGDRGYAELAHTVAQDVIARATRRPDGGLAWVHAENRAEPYWREAHTGYMQGAAGIGSLFLRLAAHERRLGWKVRLPDNPFPIT